MITKPEDAVPDSIEIAIITAQECIDKGRQAPLFFTAAECAEIAKAYAYAERRHASAMNESSQAEYDAWRAKFAEWEGK